MLEVGAARDTVVFGRTGAVAEIRFAMRAESVPIEESVRLRAGFGDTASGTVSDARATSGTGSGSDSGSDTANSAEPVTQLGSMGMLSGPPRSFSLPLNACQVPTGLTRVGSVTPSSDARREATREKRKLSGAESNKTVA